MNAPFIVAQAITTGQSTPQIVRLTKPANGQAITLTLDANSRLDFSGIASEQITLVRVGNQLVILFDNQTTITIGPFFDAAGNPLNNLAFDLGNNRVVDGQEFSSLFPVTTDQNILPASGNAGGTGGFGFENAHVDPLANGNPLDLLGNEEGTPITFSISEVLGRDNNDETGPIEPSPTAFSQTVALDEDGDGSAGFPIFPPFLPDAVPGGPGDDPTAPLFYLGGAVSGTQPLVDFGPDGPAAVDPVVFDVTALNALDLTSGGEDVVFILTTLGVIGVTAISGNPVLFLQVDPVTGDFAVGMSRPLDHAPPADGVAFENEIVLDFPFTVTDGNGTQTTGTLSISVDDDSPDPCNPIPGFVEEGVQPLQVAIDLDLEWGADNFNSSGDEGPRWAGIGPVDRSIAFASATAGDNVVASDVNGDPLSLTSNGAPVLYTILAPAFLGGPVYLLAYTDLPAGLPPKGITESNVVFWVSLSDLNQGDAVFELRGALDHPAPGGVDGTDHFVDLTFSFKAFDSDGDGVPGTFTVRVDAAGEITFCGCGFGQIDYSMLPGGVFINLADGARTVAGETADAHTAQDRVGVTPVIGIDQLGTEIVDAIGTDSDDIIVGGADDNILDGAGGDDIIRGGAGWDEIYGGAGADEIYGGGGDDLIAGEGGADTIYGGRGDDNIQAGAGADWVQGGRGDDIINGQGGDDNLRGGRGNDEIYGGAGEDTIRGGRGNDYIEGNGDDDTIIYNVGDGQDVVFGGGGGDIQEIYGTDDVETYNINLITLLGQDFVGINIEGGFVPAPADDSNFEVATRGVEDIYIDTGIGPDLVIVSGSLNGTGLATSTIEIEGGDGDFIDGVDLSQLDSDHGVTFYGRGGSDVLAYGTGGGNVYYYGGAGTDTIDFSFVCGCSGGIEIDLSLTVLQDTNYGLLLVDSVENVNGSGEADIITGNASANILAGGFGDDILTGRGGDDTLLGNEGDDTIVYNVGDGTDIVDGGEDEEILGDTLQVNLGATDDYVRISPDLDSDPATLDIDIDANSLVENAADGIELSVIDVEEIVVNTGAGNDNVVISGDLGSTGVATSTVTVNLGEGNDTVTLDPTQGTAVNATINGGDGNDTVDASAREFRAAGPDVQVSTGNALSQSVQIATLTNGGFVVTWDSSNGGDADIRGRVYAADGTPVSGSDFLVSTTNADFQGNPQITALANGGFAVTWHSTDSGGFDIRGRVFDSAGIAAGSDFLVSNTDASDQAQPQITALANGGFMATWQSTDADSGNIRARVFDSAGTAVGGDFLVSNTDTNDQTQPQITALVGGGFAVTWHSADNGSDLDIRGRVFDSAGNAVAGDFLVSTSNANFQSLQQITALSNGGFAVTWTSGDNGSNNDIRGRVFDAAGVPVNANDFLVSTTNANGQDGPQITALANGGFAVTWQSNNGSDLDIYGRVFAADGTPVTGSDVLVSSTDASNQYSPQITALANGGFAVTWQSFENGSLDIRGRIFAADGTPIGDDFVVSTTNANSQSSPQITALPDGGFAVTWQSNENGTIVIRSRVFDNVGVEHAITFDGGLGNDVFRSGAGNDIFNGGADNDTAYYRIGDGRDVVDGGAGADVMNVTGSSAAETFNVNLINYFGVDHIGINIVAGNDASAVATAFAANSEVVTRDVEDIVIDTGAGDDVVVLDGTLGGAGLATITVDGGTGNDTDIVDARGLISNHGIVVNGRGGDDVFYSSAVLGNDTFNGGDGTDTVDFSGVGANVAIDLAVAVGQDTNFGTDTVIFVENVVGGSGNDDIFGSSAANVLDGGAGADALEGRGGNDTLLGGAGDDEIVYLLGDGVDIVDGGEADELSGDNLSIGSGAGNPDNDYIRIATDLDADGNLDIDFDANSNVEVPADGIELDVVNVEEVLVFSGAGNDNVVISGNPAAAGLERIFVFAGSGNDNVVVDSTAGTVGVTVTAGTGDDVFRSGAGDDRFLGEDDNDTLYYEIGDGRDVVDGGTESGGGKDLLDVTGTSANENFFIEIPAEYNARVNPDYAGTAEILVSSGNDILVEADEIEDIVVHGGGGADTLTVSGSFGGTSLLTATITYDSGEGNDTLDLRNRDSNHRVVSDGGSGTDTVIYDFARSAVTSISEIRDGNGVIIGANITHNTPNGPVTDVLRNFENFQFSDGTRDLNTVFNQPPNAVDDSLPATPAGLVQYEFSGVVSARDAFTPWSSTYKFTIVADNGTRVGTGFGNEIPLVTSATLALPYFSPDLIDITTPVRLGYNTTSNKMFLAKVGGPEDGYYIQLTEPQEGIALTQSAFGPLIGVDSKFFFVGLRDIIGSFLPERVVFTDPGSFVTAELTSYVAARFEDTTFTLATSSFTRNDSDPDGNPITLVSVQGAVGGSVGLAGDNITFTPTADYSGAASFTYTIRDSVGATDTATVNFNITAVNDAPFLDLDGNDSTISGNEYITTATTGGPAVRIVDTDMILSDVDDTHLEGLTVSITNPKLGDLLTTNPALIPNGISFNAGASTPGNLVFTGHATPADYETLLRNITFQTTSGDTTLRFLSVSVADGDSGFAVTSLVAINSAPAITSVQNGDVTEDAGASATGPNLIVNGGFDSYSLVPDSPVIGFIATLPGWTRQGTSFQVDFDDFVSSTASLQINGLSNISQNITTVAGQRYELSFWHDGPTSQTTQAWFNGGLLINATPLGANDPFRLYTVEFEGTGGAAELRFTQPGFGSSNLDNVAVRLLAPPAQQADSGTIAFTDVNVTNLHSASYVAQGGGAGYVGTFSLGAVDQNGKSVGWNFVADNSALQFLSANQTVTQTYAVTVTDNHGASTTQNVTVLLHGVNDAVTITSNNGDPLAVSVVENNTTVATIVASDVDLNDPRVWSVTGTDAALFDISATGVLTFVNAPDFEAPVGGDNIYNVTVQVSDGTVTDTQAVQVTVTDVIEATPNTAPVLGAISDRTVVDQFTSQNYGLNNGTHSWVGAWSESDSAATSPTTGDIQVVSDDGDFSLRFTDNDSANSSITRIVDLSGAGSASLSFDYKRVDLDGDVFPGDFGDYVSIQLSRDGINFQEIGLVGYGNNDDYRPSLDDISAYISSQTYIRLVALGTLDPGDTIYLDDITVTYSLPGLSPVLEDAGAPVNGVAAGDQVSRLVDLAGGGGLNNVTDSAGALTGIALTATDTTNGTWFFSLNDGGNWSAVGSVSDTQALLLSADARLYFQPDADWNGVVADAITFRAWDQTSGANGAYVDVSVNGGSTAFSSGTDTVDIAVASVNDPGTDFVITNAGTAPITIPEEYLLENDTDLFGYKPFEVTGVGGAAGGTVSFDGSIVTFTDDATLSGSFTYTGIEAPAPGTVTVTNVTSSTLTGGNAGELMFGGSGDDLIIGNGGRDWIYGNDGNDVIRGGAGSDKLYGGAGIDMLDLSDAVQQTGDPTFDGIYIEFRQSAAINIFDQLQSSGLGRDEYYAMEGVIGSPYDDYIAGQFTANDIFWGGAGNDTIFGRNGDDIIRGGFGNEVDEFGIFNDHLDGEGGIDLLDLSEASGALTFTLTQSSSVSIFDFSSVGLGYDRYYNFEGVIGSAYSDNLTGSGNADILQGGAGNDTLRGGAGIDQLTGGTGADTYAYAETGATNRDTILDYNFGEGDKLDLSSLLDANFGNGSQEGHFVKLVESGGNTTVQVDTNGPVGGFNYVDVAVLQGYTGSVKAVFENVEHTLTA